MKRGHMIGLAAIAIVIGVIAYAWWGVDHDNTTTNYPVNTVSTTNHPVNANGNTNASGAIDEQDYLDEALQDLETVDVE